LWRRPRPKLGCGAKERRRRRKNIYIVMRKGSKLITNYIEQSPS
jgi:hypothetical protein